MNERYPKVFVTRRLRKDGGAYFGPYFPGNLAHRLVDLIHRSFLIPSCKVDLNRYHARACLQFYIKRCLGPCVDGFISTDDYKQHIRDVQLFLEGRSDELEDRLTKAHGEGSRRDALRSRRAPARPADHRTPDAATNSASPPLTTSDADVFGFHYENEMLAVNLFHMRGGKIVDRRDFFWEDLPGVPRSHAERRARLVSTGSPHSNSVPHPFQPRRNGWVCPRLRVPQASLLRPGFPDPTVNPKNPSPPWNPPRPSPHPRSMNPAVPPADVVPVSAHGHARAQARPFRRLSSFSALLKQLYLDQTYIPRSIYVPVDFPDRAILAELLSDRTRHKVELAAPQRGDKRSLVDLVCQNAKPELRSALPRAAAFG